MALVTFPQALALQRGLYIDYGTSVSTSFDIGVDSLEILLSNQPLGVIVNVPGLGFITPGSNDTFSLLLPDTLINNANAQSLSFHGFSNAPQFIQDLKNGIDSLDILLIGDSNIGYATAGIYGYGNGITQTLVDLQIPIYATSLAPGLSRAQLLGSSPSNAYMQIAGITNNPGRTNEQDASTGVTWLTPGNETSYTEIKNIWNSGSSNELSHSGGETRLDWAFVEPNATFSGNFYIQVAANSPFGITGSMIFRVGYATFTASGGNFKPRIFSTPTLTQFANATISTERLPTDTDVYKVVELTANIPENNTEAIRCSKYGGGAAVSPCGFLFESLVKPNTKGFSVSTYLHRSGGITNTTIKAAVTETKNSTLRIYLKELRERQIACGGSGRVLVFTNSGVNSNELSTNFVAGINEIYEAVKFAWEANGFPLENLAFVSTTTAPPDANYISSTYTAFTAQNNNGIKSASNFKFSFVSMSTLTSSAELTAGSYHAGAGNTVHLSNTGYNFVANKIIQQLLNVNYVRSSERGGDIQENGYLTSFEENYHKTGVMLLKKLK